MTPNFFPLRKNRRVGFGFCGATVLVAWCGDQVSFNTTVEGGWSVMESKDCNFFLYPYIHSEMKVFKSTKPPSQFSIVFITWAIK
jgi:hypothetical protein